MSQRVRRRWAVFRSLVGRGGRALLAALVAVALLPAVRPLAARDDFQTAFGLQPLAEPLQAPEISAKDPSGSGQRLTGFRGKLVLLNFFATWCGPCREEMPALERLYRAYREQGFVVLGVDYRESAGTVRDFLAEMKVSFPAVLDESGQAVKAYGIRPLPASFLIGRDGRILWRAFGARPWDAREFRKYLEGVLRAERPAKQ